jgi:tRNA(Arg) A34 adenosine deaminase TadA
MIDISKANKDPMGAAFEQAHKAEMRGEVPIGAALVNGYTGTILTAQGNRVEELKDPTAHAEILLIREATKLEQSPRLVDYDLYVTLEPCPMCAQAISFARIRRLFFAAYDAKGGGVDHGPRIYSQTTCHHAPEVIGGVREQQAVKMLQAFFKSKRK